MDSKWRQVQGTTSLMLQESEPQLEVQLKRQQCGDDEEEDVAALGACASTLPSAVPRRTAEESSEHVADCPMLPVSAVTMASEASTAVAGRSSIPAATSLQKMVLMLLLLKMYSMNLKSINVTANFVFNT